MTTEKGGRPTSADDDRIALRRAEAVKLRARGKTFQEIADALDIGVATAHLDVRTAMTEIAKEAEENVQAERGTELSRLQRALAVVEDVLLDEEPTAPAKGEDYSDFEERVESSRELKLKALDRLVKIQDQRAKLLGLYAPEKRDVTQVTTNATPAEAARLIREGFGGQASNSVEGLNGKSTGHGHANGSGTVPPSTTDS